MYWHFGSSTTAFPWVKICVCCRQLSKSKINTLLMFFVNKIQSCIVSMNVFDVPFSGEPNDNSRRIVMEAKLPKSCNLPSFDSFVTRQHKPAGGSICVLAPPIFCHRSSSSPFTISKVMMLRILMIMMMIIVTSNIVSLLAHL